MPRIFLSLYVFDRLSISNSSISKPQHSMLRILPEESQLRRGGPFLAPVNWPPQEGADPPRALRGLANIIEGGLCHRCGSCVGICPTKVLGLDKEGFPEIKALSACTDCDLCVKVCPGDEFDFQKHHREAFGVESDLTKTHGHFEEAFIAYATDEYIRNNSTSGGLVTALLIHMMESKQIDGAVVITSDDGVLWKGNPRIARDPDTLRRAMKSKYAISPTNAVFSEILETPGRYALVGLPCQIHGFVKAAELDSRLKERVVLTIGLLCHAAVEHESYEVIWKSLGEKANQARSFVSRVGKHPGAPHVELPSGDFYPVYFGDKAGYRPSSMEIINLLYRIYSPPRCLTCFDATSELADISIGDPWMAPPDSDVNFEKGWSFALVRSSRAREICRSAEQQGRIFIKKITEREALACNRMMTTEKRWRAFRIIETHRRQGKPIPSYGPFGMEMPKASGKQFLKTEVNMLTHFLCFITKFRAPTLRFFLSNAGYRLLWLNYLRRRVREFIRNTKSSMRRTLFGRS